MRPVSVHVPSSSLQQAPIVQGEGAQTVATPWSSEPQGQPVGPLSVHTPVTGLQQAPEHGVVSQTAPLR